MKRPPFSRLINAFPPEPATNKIPRTKPQRAAKLAADWNQCLPEYQAWIERQADRLATLSRKGRAKTRG